MSRILIADVETNWKKFSAALAGHELICVSTLHEAESALRQHLDLIVCGTQFDDSRMFELLRLAKSHADLNDTPFLCAETLTSDFELTSAQNDSVKPTVCLLGAIDLVDLKRVLMDDVAEVRGIVESYLPLLVESHPG